MLNRAADLDGPTRKASVWMPGGVPGSGRIARARLGSKADVESVNATPAEDLFPSLSILGCLTKAAEADPDKAAVLHLPPSPLDGPPKTLSYRELVRRVAQAANLFHEVSAGGSSSVAVILPMRSEALFAIWGAATAGIAVPLNPFLELKHAVAIMNTAKVTALVAGSAAHGDGLWNKIAEIKSLVPTLRQVFIVDRQGDELDFTATLDTQAGELAFSRPVTRNTEAIYLPTGGTTAAPKLVRMTHFGQLLNAWNMAALMGSGADEVVGHAFPFFHVGGLVTMALRALIFGQTLVILTTDGFRNPLVIRDFWMVAERYGLTTIVATPTTVAALVADALPAPAGHRLRTFHCGGSTIPVEMVKQFHARFGVWPRETWGLSEVYGCVTGQPDGGEPPIPGSVGHVLPYHELKVVDLDDDGAVLRECRAGERGVLIVTGDAVVPGYAEPVFDAELFLPPLGDGKTWLNTGDLGALDENGYAWLYGREKDVIIRGGHNIDPKMIEEVLGLHPAVQLAAAIGRPDRLKGEMPMAYVQLRKGAETTAEDLIAFCRQHMQERAAVPDEIVLIDQMPVTPVGKVFKPTLRVEALERVSSRRVAELVPVGTEVAIRVDESGRRPEIVLQVTCGRGPVDSIARALRDGFAGFGFMTRVDVVFREIGS